MLDSADQIGQERTTNDGPIIPRATDFAQWYQDIIAAAELVDQAPVRGCYILRPNGYFKCFHTEPDPAWDKTQECKRSTPTAEEHQ